MKEAALFALSEGMEIDQIQKTEAGLVVSVVATQPQSCCPLCLQASSHVHSQYHRTLRRRPLCRTPASAFSDGAQVLLP